MPGARCGVHRLASEIVRGRAAPVPASHMALSHQSRSWADIESTLPVKVRSVWDVG